MEYVAPGTKVGPYVVVGVLGHGDLGITLRAIDDAGDEFAVKLLLPVDSFPDADARARIGREFAAVAALNLPEVVPVARFGRYGEHVLVATQRFPGTNLAERLAVSALPLDATLVLVRHLARCLGEVHRAGVTHGGVKPTNILRRNFGGRDLPVLVDFGAALRHLPWTAFDESVREDWFSAPEVRRGELATPPSDVYSLGRLLELMLAGRAAAPGIVDVITVATADERDLRYYDAAAFLADLERALSGTPTQAAEVLAAFEAAQREPAADVAPPADSDGPSAEPGEAEPGEAEAPEAVAEPRGRRGLRRHRRPWKPTMPWILGVGALAGVVAIASATLIQPHVGGGQPVKNGVGPGKPTGGKPGTPGVVAVGGYEGVEFDLTRAEGDATVVQIDKDGVWEDVATASVTIPTITGGQQACIQVRSADKSGSAPTYSDPVNLCGTSQPASLSVTRTTPCTVNGRKGVCYQVQAVGFEANSSPELTLHLAGAAKGKLNLVIGTDGRGSLAKGQKLAFAASDAGKVASITAAGVSATWTVDQV